MVFLDSRKNLLSSRPAGQIDFNTYTVNLRFEQLNGDRTTLFDLKLICLWQTLNRYLKRHEEI